VSDVSQGPGWWLASDGKWYSPEQVPGYASTGPAPGPSPGTAYGAPGQPPGYSSPAYPSPTGPAGYAYPGAGGSYGFVPLPKTNGLAVAAMVCSFFFWIYGIGAVLGIVFGFIARSQIKRSGGSQQGKGMALAGIIIGFAGIAIGIALVIVLVVVVNHCEHNGTCTTTTFNTGG
jgi:Domain of unknown function (DUF4190)